MTVPVYGTSLAKEEKPAGVSSGFLPVENVGSISWGESFSINRNGKFRIENAKKLSCVAGNYVPGYLSTSFYFVFGSTGEGDKLFIVNLKSQTDCLCVGYNRSHNSGVLCLFRGTFSGDGDFSFGTMSSGYFKYHESEIVSHFDEKGSLVGKTSGPSQGPYRGALSPCNTPSNISRRCAA